MIHFNKPDDKERAKAKPLTLEEESLAVNYINDLIRWSRVPVPGAYDQLIQRLIHNYENLCHYKAYTSGNTEAQDKFFER